MADQINPDPLNTSEKFGQVLKKGSKTRFHLNRSNLKQNSLCIWAFKALTELMKN